MDIYSVNGIDTAINSTLTQKNTKQTDKNTAFESLFQSALSMINETNGYIKNAQETEISYVLGEIDSPVELQEAQNKANISLQYTVAIKNAVMEAYKEIMQLQF